MSKKVVALMLVLALCFAFAACGSSAPADVSGPDETELAPISSQLVTLMENDTITFNVYDNDECPVVAVVAFDDFSAQDSTALILYLVSKLSEKYPNFEVSGHFGGSDCCYVYTDGEVNAAASTPHTKWYSFADVDEYSNYMFLWHSDDMAAIDAAIAEL